MKIVDVRANVLRPSDMALQWCVRLPPRCFEHMLVRICADDGTEGHCLSYLLSVTDFEASLPALRRVLVGRDPHDIEAILNEQTDHLFYPTILASHVDICLWDLVGKLHGVPTYKLLGAARDECRGYASTYMYDTVQEYVDVALACRAEGFNALKIHAFGIPDKDIEVCRAVRGAVGETMDLMLDPVMSYDRRGAFRVGDVLQELDFYWYECPLPDSDVDGYRDLTQYLGIQVAATEAVAEGLVAYPRYLVGHAVDSIRCLGDYIGGITAMKKTASLCQAFNVKFEPHSYGTTLIQAAHFAVILSIANCDFIELPVPSGLLDVGMKDTLRVNSEGNVPGPTKPGLGYEVDWEEIERLTVRVL